VGANLAPPRWVAAPRLAHPTRCPRCVELRLIRPLEGSPRGNVRAHRFGPARGTTLRPCTPCRHACASRKRARRSGGPLRRGGGRRVARKEAFACGRRARGDQRRSPQIAAQFGGFKPTEVGAVGALPTR
jgi:hypothetical protein